MHQFISLPRPTNTIVLIPLLVLATLTTALSADPARRSQEGVRRGAFGWEAQGKHFVVLDPDSRERAVRLLQNLEQGWEDSEQWAKNWRADNRVAESTGLIPVCFEGAKVVNPGRRFRGTAITVAESGMIRLPKEIKTQDQADADLHLRTLGAKKELESSGETARLPDWVTDGLARFVVEPAVSIDWFRVNQNIALPARQNVASPQAEWVSYLLTADDGRQAAAMFELLRQAAKLKAPNYRDVRLGRANFRAVEPPRLASDKFVTLFRDLSKEVAFANWPADASLGQPVVSRLAGEYDTLPKQRQIEMAQLLKLAKKFGQKNANVLPSDETGKKQNLFNRGEPQVTIDYLKQSLLSGRDKTWSTLDTDGELLTWQNRKQLAEFLDRAKLVYRFVWHEEQTVLEWKTLEGELYRASLSVDDRAPQRPIVNFTLVVPDEPK